MTKPTTRRAKANPTKAFFVRMLTRDIALTDCVLDLVDNSIDGAWAKSSATPTDLIEDDALHRFRIDLTINADSFTIQDNCGGIDLDDAVNYAFTFGRSDEDQEQGYSVGVYGIGMKRAVFKMGDKVRIHSTFDDSGLDAFEVPIDVSDWLADKDEPWDFELLQASPATEPGVTISVRELYEEARATFGDPTYIRRLRSILARDYMVPLMRGLTIRLNGVDVVPRKINFAYGGDFAPMRYSYSDGGVLVEVIAGMTSQPPDDVAPSEAAEEDTSGWYILCNGRVVLAADRSEATVWGSVLPRWHRQYAGFTGVVLFSSTDPILLPMTTTKRNVDVESSVYRRAVDKMARPTRDWITYTNSRKSDLDAARKAEAAVAGRSVIAVVERPSLGLPALTRSSKARVTANVAYSVDASRLRSLAAALGDVNMTYRDVGLKTFEMAYEDFVEVDGS